MKATSAALCDEHSIGETGSVFDEVIDRERSNSMKWSIDERLLAADEVAARPLAMWVADMDFRAPRPVIDALHEAVEHGIFGYPGGATDRYVNAVIDWQAKRFGWGISKDWVQSATTRSSLFSAIPTIRRATFGRRTSCARWARFAFGTACW